MKTSTLSNHLLRSGLRTYTGHPAWWLLSCLFVLVAFISLAPAAKNDLQASASLSETRIGVGETTTLTIEVQGTTSSIQLHLPEIKGLTYYRQGQSSQIKIINGHTSSSVATTYLVEPREPGNYTIPPIEIEAGSKILKTDPLELVVTDQPQSPALSSSQTAMKGDDIAFLQVEGARPHYLGEQIPVRIRAWFHEGVRVEIEGPPKIEGNGVLMQLANDKVVQHEENVGGENWSVLTWKATLTGVGAGSHQLSFSLDSILYLQDRKRRSFGSGLFDDPFFHDPFFDNFFGNYRKKRFNLRTQPLDIKVLPLPEKGRPADFSGAVGSYSFQVSASPTTVNVGEPITLTMKIVGSGDLDRIRPPKFPDNGGWRSYQPTSSTRNNEKTVEQAIVPKTASITEIPSLRFSYFDPRAKKYVSLESRPIPITVNAEKVQSTQEPAGEEIAPRSVPKATVAVPPESTAGKQATTTATVSQASRSTPARTDAEQMAAVPGENLAPLHLHTGPFSRDIQPLFLRGWYLTVVCILLFTLLLCSIHRILGEFLSQRAKNRTTNKVYQTQLAQLAACRDRGDIHGFLQGSRSLIQQYLGRQWNQPPDAISLSDLTHRLPGDSPLLEIFQAALAASYGHSLPRDSELERWYRELRQILTGNPSGGAQ